MLCYAKWREANTKGAIVSGLEALGDTGATFLKDTPIGFAVSLGWTIFSSWWN